MKYQVKILCIILFLAGFISFSSAGQEKLTSERDVKLFDLENQNLAFSVYKDIDERTEQMLKEIYDFNSDICYKVGVFNKNSKGIYSYSQIADHMEIDSYGAAELEEKFHHEFIKKYPEFKNTENYFEMLCQLPAFLAPKGIYAKIFWLQTYLDNGDFMSVECSVGFFKVTKKDKSSQKIWNETIDSDIVFLENLVLDEKDISIEISALLACYQNIVFHEKKYMEQFQEKQCTNDPKIIAELNKFSQDDFWGQLSRAENKNYVRSFALDRLIFKIDNKTPTYEEEFQLDLVHESSHLQDEKDQNYQAKLKPTIHDNYYSWHKEHDNYCTWSEIKALITQAKYGIDKKNTLRFLINNYDLSQQTQDFSHDVCCNWFDEKVIDYVIADLESYFPKYGFKIVYQDINPRWQVLFQFADFIKKPEVLEDIADKIYQDFRKMNYQPTFDQEYIDHSLKTDVRPKEFKPIRINRIYNLYLIALVVLLIGVIVAFVVFVIRTPVKKKRHKQNGRKKK